MPDTADDSRQYDDPTQIQPRSMTPNTDAKAARPANRANDTDRHCGARIRERRIMLGLSQQQMADLIGVTYQQAHKYERGINRISAGRLYEIAQVLGVPVSYFFEGLDSQRIPDLTARQRMCLELARNFSSIQNEKHQEALSQLARALAHEG
jgi:transcriptional regulator with XRE-family HTH domain